MKIESYGTRFLTKRYPSHMYTKRCPFHSESNTDKIERISISHLPPEVVNSDWTRIKKMTYNLKMALAGSALPQTSLAQRLSGPRLYQRCRSLSGFKSSGTMLVVKRFIS